jgi:hypothetical protein
MLPRQLTCRHYPHTLPALLAEGGVAGGKGAAVLRQVQART